MTKNEILDNFKFEGKYSEQLKGQFVTLDGEQISLEKFAKTFYESGLKRSFEEEVKKYVDWQTGNFEEDKFNVNYYVVLTLRSPDPILCFLSNGVFRVVSNNRHIMKDEIVSAKKIEIPQKTLDYINNYIETNRKEITLKNIGDDIVYGSEVSNFAKMIIQQANLKNINIQELIDTLEYDL